MKLLYLLVFLIIDLHAFSIEGKEGETLYLDNNCQKCHYSGENYDPKEHKVKTLKDIDGWVSSCALHFKIAWFPEEEKMVAKYLNEIFYKLEK